VRKFIQSVKFTESFVEPRCWRIEERCRARFVHCESNETVREVKTKALTGTNYWASKAMSVRIRLQYCRDSQDSAAETD
jgi:hypothetical protein